MIGNHYQAEEEKQLKQTTRMIGNHSQAEEGKKTTRTWPIWVSHKGCPNQVQHSEVSTI